MQHEWLYIEKCMHCTTGQWEKKILALTNSSTLPLKGQVVHSLLLTISLYQAGEWIMVAAPRLTWSNPKCLSTLTRNAPGKSGCLRRTISALGGVGAVLVLETAVVPWCAKRAESGSCVVHPLTSQGRTVRCINTRYMPGSALISTGFTTTWVCSVSLAFFHSS